MLLTFKLSIHVVLDDAADDDDNDNSKASVIHLALTIIVTVAPISLS